MSGPQVRIVEQPAEKSFRFRYESEGRLNGSLFGEKNTSKKVSYPKIEISNFTGTAVIIVSCVTNDKNGAYKQHPHKLSSKNKLSSQHGDDIGGVFTMKKEVHQSAIIEFKDIGIVFVKKENIKSSLEGRKKRKIDPTQGGWDHKDMQQFIDLHCVRLCFQVISEEVDTERNHQVCYKQIGCVVSNPIMDKKSHGSLRIVELSASKSSVMGGERLILLCDRVKREDIEIVFYEQDSEKNMIWRKVVNYQNSHTLRVHHQHAISFQAPQYKDIDILEPHQIFVQLYRPSDRESSESLPFEFIPNEHSKVRRKKHKKMNETAIAPLNAFATQLKNKAKYVPNIQENISVDVNRSNEADQIVDPRPLIDLSSTEEKENRPVPNPMQQYRGQNSYQAPARPFEMQYSHYPSNIQRPNDNQFYYPQYAVYQNNNHELGNQQLYNSRPIHMLPNIYQHQQPHHTANVYANDCGVNEYGGHRMNPALSHTINSAATYMPPAYNDNFNIPPNKQSDHMMNIKATDATSESNMPHFSDSLMQHTTNEIYDVVNHIEKLTDSMNSMELKQYMNTE